MGFLSLKKKYNMPLNDGIKFSFIIKKRGGNPNGIFITNKS